MELSPERWSISMDKTSEINKKYLLNQPVFIFSTLIEAMLCNDGYIVGAPEYFPFSTAPKPKNFMPKIKKKFLTSWFENHIASWNDHFKPEFAEILTRSGYGFVFNMLPKKLLFTDKYDI
jgi:hypothetical protein